MFVGGGVVIVLFDDEEDHAFEAVCSAQLLQLHVALPAKVLLAVRPNLRAASRSHAVPHLLPQVSMNFDSFKESFMLVLGPFANIVCVKLCIVSAALLCTRSLVSSGLTLFAIINCYNRCAYTIVSIEEVIEILYPLAS